jgi:cold shock CspA family protein/ribosome-associated translation inhibitor RaiA
METQVEAQHTEVDPTLRDWIHARCTAWNMPYEDIVHARVTLVKHPRHLRGSDEARVFLTLSGKTLSVTRTGDTLEEALYEACDVMERELHDFRSLRRGVSKDSGPRVRGRIVRLFADRGYGFIATDTHREVYFHANAVHGMPFAQLQLDTVVDLDIEAGHQGPQATRVTPHWP